MSIGGTWTGQNKILPGAYINFASVARPTTTIGDRGIVIIPMTLSFGATDRLIELESIDLTTGASLAKVGFTAFDPESKLANLALQNTYKLLIFRTNANGTKASAEFGDLIVTAQHPGLLGNKIQVSIVAMDNDRFEVKTFVNARQVDRQIVSYTDELIANDFVVFSGDGALEEFAGQPLSGGTDGTATQPSAWMPDFLEFASLAHWHTMVVPIKDDAISKGIVTFINEQRNNQGRYVQAVVNDYPADHEGIINSTMGAVIDGVTVTPAEFTAWFAGATAGAAINQSNTSKVVVGATEIIGELNRSGLEQATLSGKITLKRLQDGRIAVVQDINSFTSFTPSKNKEFSKNRVIRTLDEIGMTTKSVWENAYEGKVTNDEAGRASFKGEMIFYYRGLQNLQGGAAITNFIDDDITVDRGIDADAVVLIANIQPVDSMEKLYKAVNIVL